MAHKVIVPADIQRKVTLARVVLDTNIVCKWYVTASEEHVSAAWVVLQRYRNGEIAVAVPSILRYELTNWLGRAVRQHRLTAPEAASAYDDFLSLALPEIGVHGWLASALHLSLQLGCSTFDSLFLIVARELSWPLLTEDRALAARAELVGVEVCQLADLPWR